MQNLGSINETLQSEGWAAIKVAIKERKDAAMLQLASVKRPAEPSDDALRGLISGLDWVLNVEVRATRALAEIETEREEQVADTSGVGNPMEPEAPTE